MQIVSKSLLMKTVGNMDISALQTRHLQNDNSPVTSPRHSMVFMHDVRMSPIACNEAFGCNNIKMLFESRAWKDLLAWWAFNLLIGWCSSLHKCFLGSITCRCLDQSTAMAYYDVCLLTFCVRATKTIIEPLLLQNFSTSWGVGL